jgi:apolipoprotein N-acyltransferase
LALALQGQSARRGFLLGCVSGLAINLFGFYWLYGTIERFGELPAPIAAAVMLLLSAFQSGRMGLVGWLHGRGQSRGWSSALLLLLALPVSELVYPVIFPWFFAASVHQVPSLSQAAELGGPYLVGVVLAAPSLSLADSAIRRGRGLPIRWSWVALGLSVPLVSAGFGVLRLRQLDARLLASQPVHVGIVQGNLPPNPSAWDRMVHLSKSLRMSNDLRAQGADFVVWSEAAVDGLPNRGFSDSLRRLVTGKIQLPALIGAGLVEDKAHGRREFNSAIATASNGEAVGRYDKHHLFPFGEAIPFAERFPFIYKWLPNASRLVPGTTTETLLLAGHPITTLICYEDILPAFARDEVARDRPEMLINLTNDVWFGDTTEPWIHLALAQTRAIEHRLYLLRATNSGVSAVIDPAGRVAAHSTTFQAQTLDAVAHWMRGPRTGYELWGDVPVWLATAALGFMALFERRRRAR